MPFASQTETGQWHGREYQFTSNYPGCNSYIRNSILYNDGVQINALEPSVASMRQLTRLSLIQIMACRLTGTIHRTINYINSLLPGDAYMRK